MKPGSLEIICARTEQYLTDKFNEVMLQIGRSNPFPRLSFSADILGLANATIRDRATVWKITGLTTLGNPIIILVDISHDESWVSVVTVWSLDLDEPVYVVVTGDIEQAASDAISVIRDLVEAAATKSRYEREHWHELVKSTDNITFYG